MAQKLTSGIKKLAVVRPSVIATTFSGRSEKFLKQQRINLVLSGLYLLQAILITIFGHSAVAPVTLQYLATDPLQSAAQHTNVLTLATHRWFDLNLHCIVVLALLLAALGHLLFATALRARYEQALSRRLQDMRWLAGAIIASLLVVAVAVRLGISDAGVLAALIGVTILNGLGALAVEANQKLWPWGLFVGVGMCTGLVVIAQSMVAGLLYGTALPWSTYAFVAVLAVGIAAGLANLWLQIRGTGKWSDYVFVEMMYAGVGIASISACAWILFVGVL